MFWPLIFRGAVVAPRKLRFLDIFEFFAFYWQFLAVKHWKLFSVLLVHTSCEQFHFSIIKSLLLYFAIDEKSCFSILPAFRWHSNGSSSDLFDTQISQLIFKDLPSKWKTPSLTMNMSYFPNLNCYRSTDKN